MADPAHSITSEYERRVFGLAPPAYAVGVDVVDSEVPDVRLHEHVAQIRAAAFRRMWRCSRGKPRCESFLAAANQDFGFGILAGIQYTPNRLRWGHFACTFRPRRLKGPSPWVLQAPTIRNRLKFVNAEISIGSRFCPSIARLFGDMLRRIAALPEGQGLRVAGEDLANKARRDGKVSAQSLGERVVPSLPVARKAQLRPLRGLPCSFGMDSMETAARTRLVRRILEGSRGAGVGLPVKT